MSADRSSSADARTRDEVLERTECVSAHEVLKRFFGYETFRAGQQRLIDAVLAGCDVLGVMPTGAGKSICYQVPALMLQGMTIVVSPLVSLMADQVRSLMSVGARPAYLNSSLSPSQQATVMCRAQQGSYQIMYVAPERLSDPRFVDFARRAAGAGGIGLPLVAIDEAHCVSQWGQDFRPAYLGIADFIDALDRRPIVAAFTATATERVREDITNMLGLRSPQTAVTGFDRANLSFSIEELGERAKTAWIRDYALAHSRESGIIYCSTRKAVDALAEELERALSPDGIRVGRYHAGMGARERQVSQRAFIDDAMPVIVATNAFGMGIDKPNVRYVIHNNVPESIEAYYQEAGRAGRDGDPASAHLLWNGNDFRLRRFLIDRDPEDERSSPEQREHAKMNRFRLLNQMEGYCQTTGCLREYILRYFGDEHSASKPSAIEGASESTGCGNCSNCLSTFEVEDVTETAREILEFVSRNPARFGKTLIADALHGARNERVRSSRLDADKGCGALSAEPLRLIKTVIDQLSGRGYLAVSQGHYPVIGLGPRSEEALSAVGAASADFSFTMKRRASRRASAHRARRVVDLLREESGLGSRPRAGDDAELFERLRGVRTTFATQRQLPPYMICSDAALRGMCRLRPATRAQLLDVNGIGEKKAAEFGEEFLAEIVAFERAQR
nr:ATP-dependent DNA helicase RecQ [Coriobacterium glomerans]